MISICFHCFRIKRSGYLQASSLSRVFWATLCDGKQIRYP